MKLELNEDDRTLERVKELMAYQSFLLGAIPDDIGVGIDSEVLSGQIALLEIQQQMIQAAIDQARPARPKLKTA